MDLCRFLFRESLHHILPFNMLTDNAFSAGIIGVEADDKLEKSDPGKNGGTNSEKFSVSLDDGVMFKVVGGILDHDRTHFTQGLTYSKHSDILFQSNGLKGKSSVCRLNATTGSSISCVDMEKQYFGEGIQVYGKPGEEKLIQITWTSHEGFIYDSETLDVIRKFTFSTTKNEGWGICYDEANNIFIVSDGSHYLHFWDGDTLEQKQRVAVTRMNGGQANKINELEFVNGKVLANIWYEDVIIVIDPLTGTVESEYGECTLTSLILPAAVDDHLIIIFFNMALPCRHDQPMADS